MSDPNLREDVYTLFEDIRISFTDSGAPPNANKYTTLIVVHGTGFLGAGFAAMQALAPANNLRVVAMDRRGYRGSTPFTEPEMEDFRNGKRDSVDRLMRVFVAFLVSFIEKEKIPKLQEGGGVGVMGWSSGVITALSIFSDPDTMGPETYSMLEEYLKDVILYDPPYLALGYPLHPDFQSPAAYVPWNDPKATPPEEKYGRFAYWVSCYYEHDHTIISTQGLDGYDLRSRTNRCLAETWSEEQAKMFIDANAIPVEFDVRSHPSMQLHIRRNTERALFDKKLFPRVKLTYLYAPESPWTTVWAYLETKRLYMERNADDVRSLEFVEMKGANHFIHQISPEDFMAYVVKPLSSA
ncbi:hypothetical protein Moror_16909 [Moniliophthora roreri MCA 2997]|uniref:AB hydrolase-1 domain-containing protein n=2 Tax=Moniliophthora roreri TaxID=221103 RepID=V2X7H5_MONRO|nr:hypothetical protein Moror_16909 [Moniliophthora roreri MCA 2997]KAI3596402.1 hypothetical protein WG66_003094 [Moniliophthora roreri]